MKYLQLCIISFVIGCFVVDIKSLPIENVKIPTTLPVFIPDDILDVTEIPKESVVATVPVSLLDVETTNPSSTHHSEESQRTARGLGFGGLGGKFGGFGLGLKSFGGFGGWGLGGLHGLGGGFGGFKPFFGKHFG